MTTIIGRKYYPVDNSYSVCLSDGQTDYMLGGNHFSDPKQKEECIIVSEPFDMVVASKWTNKEYTRKMVLVTCPRGYTHCVLFHEHGFENREMLPSHQYTPFRILKH